LARKRKLYGPVRQLVIDLAPATEFRVELDAIASAEVYAEVLTT